MEAITNQLQTPSESQPYTAEILSEPTIGLTARLGNLMRSGYDSLIDNIDSFRGGLENLKQKGKSLAAIGGIALAGTGVLATEMIANANADPVGPEGNVPAATASSFSLEQECARVALQKPKIVKSEVLHIGNFDRNPHQEFYLSTRYKSMPEVCRGVYARGNQAKAQAFRKGHWVNMGYWGGVSIIDSTLAGNWEELGTEKNLQFPVCRARILLKTNLTDLSVNTGKVWAPHKVVDKKTYIIPADLLPHAPNVC